MIILKTISTAIDIQDCIGIYMDPDNILRRVESTFQGKCYMGAYILQIKRIIRISECEINQDGAPSAGRISIIFEALVLVYVRGEIINGCTVKNRVSDMLVCDTAYANICVNKHPLAGSITPGQIISVRVISTKYQIGAVKVSINASIYLPQTESIIYKIGPITPDIKAFLGNVLARIKDEEAGIDKLKETNPKALNFFTQILYAYRSPQTAPNGAKEFNIKDFINNPPKTISYLSRDRRIELSRPFVYGYEQAAGASTLLDTRGVLLTLLEDYCAHLRTIREMIEIYSTESLIQSHGNIWLMFKKSQA